MSTYVALHNLCSDSCTLSLYKCIRSTGAHLIRVHSIWVQEWIDTSAFHMSALGVQFVATWICLHYCNSVDVINE